MKATEVIGLVMLAMRKMDVSSIGREPSSRATPWLLKWTISSSRATRS